MKKVILRQVVNKTQARALRQLRKHCLEPGYYAQHLTRWLAHKQAQKILIIDGEKLKTEPFGVMNQVQDFLDVEKIDYSKLIKFDKRKGVCLCVVCVCVCVKELDPTNQLSDQR